MRMRTTIRTVAILAIGVDLGSPMSLDYFDSAPFKFDGKIEKLTVELK